MLEKTLESPLDCKEIQTVHSEGNQPWVFIGRTDAVAEVPVLWPSDMKSWLIGKDPDDGKDWEQEKKGATEDEMVVLHHQLNGYEFEQTSGNSEGQWAWRVAVRGVTKCQTLLSIWMIATTQSDDLQRRCKIRAMREKMVFPTNILKQLNIQLQLNNNRQ